MTFSEANVRRLRSAALALAGTLAIALTSCTPEDDSEVTPVESGPSEECLDSMRAAAQEPDALAAEPLIEETLYACENSDEWEEGLDRHPAAMGLMDDADISGSIDVACFNHPDAPACEGVQTSADLDDSSTATEARQDETSEPFPRDSSSDTQFQEELNDAQEYFDLGTAADFDTVANAVIDACNWLENDDVENSWRSLEGHASTSPAMLAAIAHLGPRAYCPAHLRALTDSAEGRWIADSEQGTEIEMGHAEIAQIYPDWPSAPTGTDWVPAGYEEVGLVAWDESVAFFIHPPENYECSWSAEVCSGVTILTREYCPQGVYVELPS